MISPSLVAARLKRKSPLFVCGKCLKRVRGGKSAVHAIRAEFDQQAADEKKKRCKLIRVSCLGLCPKRGVVVATPASLSNELVLIVKADADPADAGRSLQAMGHRSEGS